MRILMLTQFYAPIIGGEERHVQDLCIELVNRGHKVTVATLHVPGTAEHEVDDGVHIYRMKSTARRASWLYSQSERSHAPPVPDPEIVWSLRGLVRRERPDIVHAHNWLAYSFVPIKRWSGVPFIVSLHDYSFRCAQKRLMRFGALCDGPQIAKCMECAANHYGGWKGRVTALAHSGMNPMLRRVVDMFVAVSHATALGNGLVEDQLPFQVIPNFIPPHRGAIPQDVSHYVAQLPADGFLLFVGDLSRDKGIDVLLHAFADLKDAPPLVLIGRKRPDTPSELPANVIATGSWPHAAVMEAYRRCRFSLLPSVCAETFGIVVIEAMSMGRPVIASRIGGLSDVITDGENGVLVPPQDVEALKQAMQRLITDTPLLARLGTGALRRAQLFRASAVVPQIEALYHRFHQPMPHIHNNGAQQFGRS